MDSHYIDEQLDTIKAFHSFLSDIIDKGYDNNPVIIKSVVNVINQYIKNITEPEQSDESEQSEEDTESEDEDKQLKEKIEVKIDKFLKSTNYLSKIYLYHKDNRYNDELKKFEKNLYKY
jgi:hypothetical protein